MRLLFHYGDHENSPTFCSNLHLARTYTITSQTTMVITMLYHQPVVGRDATTAALSTIKDTLRSRFKLVYRHLS